MADEQNVDDGSFDLDESTESTGGGKKGSLLSPLLVRILMIIALFIVITLVSVLVFIIGSSIVSDRAPTTRPDDWGTEDIKRPETEHLDYLVLENAFRQQLLDGKMIQLKITLGYKSNNKKLQQEISQIKPEIRDIVIKHLSHLKSDYFVDDTGSSLEKLEEDFLKQINRILNNGKVDRILFQEYTLM